MEASEFQVVEILGVVYPRKCQSPPPAFMFFQSMTSFNAASHCQVKQLRLMKWLHNAIENVL